MSRISEDTKEKLLKTLQFGNKGPKWREHMATKPWMSYRINFFFSLSYKIEHTGNYKKVNLKELHALKKLVRLISYVDTKHEAS